MQTLEHLYGENVKISKDLYLQSVLADLCSPRTFQPQINSLVEVLYRSLFQWMATEQIRFEEQALETRMKTYHPELRLQAPVAAAAQKAVVVNLARAGTLPSHIVYENFHHILPAENLRQDHIFASRLTDTKEQVTGTQIGGAKIGGGVDQSLVVIPDPMGATGNTLVSILDFYKKNLPGQARGYVALHLIVTPEYLQRVSQAHPDLKIYALRVDRGMSSAEIQKATPGQFWAQEKGLNSRDYIVPGGGGFGEIMNNSFV